MVSSTSIRVRNTTNEETANNKSSFSKRRRPDSAYSSHQSIRDEEVSGEYLDFGQKKKTPRGSEAQYFTKIIYQSCHCVVSKKVGSGCCRPNKAAQGALNSRRTSSANACCTLGLG